MYSRKVEAALKKSGARIGQPITLRKGRLVYEGLLLPQTESGDPDTIVLKLSSGYNIGIRFDSASRISKARDNTPKSVREEGDVELGKVSKKHLKLSFDPTRPPISIISTGGTVASRIDYKTGAVSALEDPREFLHNVPELGKIVNVKKLLIPYTKMSEDMDPTDWQALATIVARELNSGMKGVIITHGTDTLHFTSAALSFMLKNLSKPVVLVGSQRSSDRGSSDAGFNLICSAHAAVSDIAEVGICMHATPEDRFCLFSRGTKVRKMHASRRDAFRPINELPLAKIYPDGKIEKINRYQKARDDSQKVEADTRFEPRVALIKAYPGSDPGIIDFFLQKGYRGFIIEGTGLGHVPTQAKRSWMPEIKKASRDGIPVVVTSQTLYGRVNPNVYTNLRILFKESGAIPGEDMLPETAYVKLGWVLGHTTDLSEVRKLMPENLAGEISKRPEPGAFLY